ncbi:hypothetical protein [Streptomyces sp. NPDC058542]|uniref:hypothetical protein n=1 Tax=Streptomyces sp. NPDC058542 TaxID=3346543 RepID=UPI00364914BD
MNTHRNVRRAAESSVGRGVMLFLLAGEGRPLPSARLDAALPARVGAALADAPAVHRVPRRPAGR